MDTIYTMHYAIFSGVDTIYTKHYAVIPGGGHYLYYSTTQYFRGSNYIYNMHYAVFSKVDTNGHWCILSKKYYKYWEDP